MKKLSLIFVCLLLMACGSLNQADQDGAETAGEKASEPVVSEQMQMDEGNSMVGGMMAGLTKKKLSSDNRIMNTDERDAKRALDIVLDHKQAQAFLVNYPEFRADVYLDEDDTAWLDFYAEEDGEWIGSAGVDLDEKSVFEANIPEVLSDQAYETQSQAVMDFVLKDAEVAALVGDPADWDTETEYDGFENSWTVGFSQKIEAVTVRVVTWNNGEWHIDDVYDPYGLEEEEALQWARDQAVELTYDADGIWEAVGDAEDWTTLVEATGEENQFTVSIISREGEHFYALVDIGVWEVLESKP